MKKVLVLGYYGFWNLGDDLILISICRRLSDMGYKVTVLSWNKPDLSIPGIRYANRFLPWRVISEIRDTDLFFFGGGGLLQDATSRFGVLYYISILFLAGLFNKKTIVFSQGIGPLFSGLNRFLVKKVLMRADILTVRDRESMRALKDIGVTKACEIVCDPVFLFEPKVHKRIPAKRSKVAVCLRPWGEKGFWEALCADLKKINSSCDVDIVFIPFHKGPDTEISERFNKMISVESSMRTWHRPEDIFDIAADMRLIICMRYHSLVVAALLGIPFIGVRCDPKLNAVAGTLGQTVYKPGQIYPAASALLNASEPSISLKRGYLKEARFSASHGFELLKKNI